MAIAAIVIAAIDPLLMRLERGADMVRSRHCSGVSARRRAGNSRAGIALSMGAIPSFSRRRRQSRRLTRRSDGTPPRFESIRVIRYPRLRIQGIGGLLLLWQRACKPSIEIRLC